MPMNPHSVGQQFHQLPMFMSAREIRSQYQALDGDRYSNPRPGVGVDLRRNDETDDQLFNRKYNESVHDDGEDGDGKTPLRDSILREGVRNPILLSLRDPGSMGRNQILGGHHRVAVMEMHRPSDLMPVEHYEDFDHALESSTAGKRRRGFLDAVSRWRQLPPEAPPR